MTRTAVLLYEQALELPENEFDYLVSLLMSARAPGTREEDLTEEFIERRTSSPLTSDLTLEESVQQARAFLRAKSRV